MKKVISFFPKIFLFFSSVLTRPVSSILFLFPLHFFKLSRVRVGACMCGRERERMRERDRDSKWENVCQQEREREIVCERVNVRARVRT